MTTQNINTKGKKTPAHVLAEIAKSNHDEARTALIERQLNKKVSELVNDFLVEMDAKNKAYAFIMGSGLFLEFRDFCIGKVAKKGGSSNA